MNRPLQIKFWVSLFAVFTISFPIHSFAWNIPAHMISGAVALQILQRESPTTISAIRSMLEKHPWYETRWNAQLEKLPAPERDEMLFMLAARWADDIRMKDRPENRPLWHYINFPFKPEGEPDSVQTKPPAPVNILTALSENEQIARSLTDPQKRAIAMTWLFHLTGDIHQPLHTTSLFTREYPHGDRGGMKSVFA